MEQMEKKLMERNKRARKEHGKSYGKRGYGWGKVRSGLRCGEDSRSGTGLERQLACKRREEESDERLGL